jgi:hypothetical protein
MVTENVFGGDDLDRLLLKLDPDKTDAWKKHEEIRRTLVKFFEWNRALRAEELADDTLARVARKLETEEVQDVRAFARGVARYVLLEESKKQWREISVEELPAAQEAVADTRDPEREIVESIDQQVINACLQQCRGKLRPTDSQFVIGYYSADGEKQKVHRQKLAEAEGMTMTALRTRANRLREKLERCVTICLEERRKVFGAAHSRQQAESK